MVLVSIWLIQLVPTFGTTCRLPLSFTMICAIVYTAAHLSAVRRLGDWLLVPV